MNLTSVMVLWLTKLNIYIYIVLIFLISKKKEMKYLDLGFYIGNQNWAVWRLITIFKILFLISNDKVELSFDLMELD